MEMLEYNPVQKGGTMRLGSRKTIFTSKDSKIRIVFEFRCIKTVLIFHPKLSISDRRFCLWKKLMVNGFKNSTGCPLFRFLLAFISMNHLAV